MDTTDQHKKDKNIPEDPVLGENNDTQNDDQGQPVASTGPEKMDLDLNQGERKERMKVDERVRRLDEVMDKAGLISDFDEVDAMDTLVKTDKKEYDDSVMTKEIKDSKN
ncbi:hypothetical protein GF362_01625 [Candidatus Dojkabacteria bacterium]|nr:hypothetical protein [Candidatus Dojkabacteria bacterium]